MTTVTEEVIEVVEEVTETPEPSVEVDANGIPVVIADDFGRMGYEKAKAESERLVSLTAQIDAYQGNHSALQEKFREVYGTDADSESTDSDRKIASDLEKAKLAVLTLEGKRDEVINARIAEVTKDAATKVAPMLEEADKIKKSVTSLRKVLVDMFGTDATYGLPTVKGQRKSSSGGGTGTPRIRGFDVYVNGQLATQADQNGKQKSHLSAAAKAANVDTSVMREAFWAAQGTQNKEQFKSRVEFTVTDPDNNEYAVIAVAQDQSE